MVPPETAGNGVVMYCVFKYALSPNKHNPGANIPSSSNFWNNDIPSNARQSEVDPGYRIDISRILPQTSHTGCLTIETKLLLSTAEKFSRAAPCLDTILLWRFMDPNQNSINGTSAAFKISCWHLTETFGNASLFVVIRRIHNGKTRMVVDCIHNVPTFFNCVCMSDTKCSHNIVNRTTRKPSYCTRKSNVSTNWTIGDIVPWTLLLPRCRPLWCMDAALTQELGRYSTSK